MTKATNLGTAGSGLDAALGTGVAGNGSEPLLLTPDTETYVYLPGVAGNYLSVPDEAALDITGDLDLRVFLACDDWTPNGIASLLGKWLTTGNQRSYRLDLFTSGVLRFLWSVDGVTTITTESTVAPSVSDGASLWVRATLDVDNGAATPQYEVKFYTSPDGTNWTQLGTTRTGATGVTSIYSGTAQPVVGLSAVGGSQPLTGRVYRAIVKNGIDGTTVLDVDCSKIESGYSTSFTANTGQVVAINRATSGRKSVVVTPTGGKKWLFGTDDYMEVIDNLLLDFEANESFTVVAVARRWATSAFSSVVAKKTSSAQTTTGYYQYFDTSTSSGARLSDGTDGPFATAQVISTEALHSFGFIRSTTDKKIKAFLDGTFAADTTDTTTGSLANSEVLRIGRLSGSGTSYADMELITVAVFRRVLSQEEINKITAYYAKFDQAVFVADSDAVRRSFLAAKLGLDPVNDLALLNVLKDAAFHIDSKAYSGGQYVQNLGWRKDSLNCRSGSAQTANTNDPTFLAHDGTNYVYLPGISSNYMSIPDENAFDITGDLDIRVEAAFDNWTSTISTLLAKRISTNGLRSYFLRISSGTVELVWSADGINEITASSTSALTTSPGQKLAIKATLDVDNGSGAYVVKFYTSSSISGTWTQLGNTITGASTTSIYSSTTAIEIGSNGSGGSGLGAAKHYRAIVKNGIDGDTVFDVDTSVVTDPSQTSFTARTGQVVAVNRSTTGKKSAVVTAPVWLFGTDDYMEVEGPVQNDTLNFGTTDSFTVVAGVRQWNTPTSNGPIVSKANGSSPYDGWAINNNSTAFNIATSLDDGPNNTYWSGSGAYSGGAFLQSGVVDRSSNILKTYINNAESIGPSISSIGSLSNSYSVSIGRTASGSAVYQDFELVSALIFRRALSAGEITTLSNYYKSRGANIQVLQPAQSQKEYIATQTGVPVTDPALDILKDATFYVDSYAGKDGEFYAKNLGWRRDALHARLGTGQGSDSGDPKYLPMDNNGPYVYLPGVAGNFLSVPDEAALDITGDIDIRCQVAMDDWTPSTDESLANKWGLGAVATREWDLRALSSGNLLFLWNDAGGVLHQSYTDTQHKFSDGATWWVRVTLDVDNGAGGHDVKFYKSSDGSSWTQIGGTLTTAGTTSVLTSSTNNFTMGATAGGAALPAAAKFYRAIIKSGIDGPTVLDVDCSRLTSGSATSFLANTGQTVSIDRSTSGRKAVAVVEPVYLFGTDDYMEVDGVLQHELLNFGATDSFTLLAVTRVWNAGVDGQAFISKKQDTTYTGYALSSGGTNPIISRIDVTSGASRIIGGYQTITNNEYFTLAGVVDRVSATANTYLNGIAGTPSSIVGYGTFASSTNLRIGSDSSGGRYTPMELIAALIIPRALSQTEITILNEFFQARSLLRSSTWYIDADRHDGTQNIKNLGWAGSILDAQSGSTTGDNVVIKADQGYVRLPGVAGNYLSVPDSSELDITGDIDIRVKVALDDWTPATDENTLLAKFTSSGNQKSYRFLVKTDGKLRLYWSTNGSAETAKDSSAAVSAIDGSVKWVRATLDVDNGAGGNDVKFWTSDDGVSWTQLGTTLTTAGVTSVFGSSAVLEIGTVNVGTAVPLAGKVYRAQVLNGIDGTTVLDVDCSAAKFPRFTALTGQTVTISQSGADVGDPLFLKREGSNYISLPGTVGNYLSTADAAALDITGDIDLRAQISPQSWTPASVQTILAKDETASTRSYRMQLNTNGTLGLSWSVDGSTMSSVSSTVSVIVSDGKPRWVRATLDADNGASGNSVRFWTSIDGNSWTQLGTIVTTSGVTSIYSGTSPLEIGSRTLGQEDVFYGTVYRVQIFRGIDGTKVLDIDTSVPPSDSVTSFRALTGQVITINRSATYPKTRVVTPKYIYFPGTVDNSLTVPDEAALDITGDIDIIAGISLDNWRPATPQWIVSKWGTSDSYSYRLHVTPTGTLALSVSADGVNALDNAINNGSTVPIPIPASGPVWVRATLDVDDGAGNRVYRYYYSTDNSGWVLLGSPITFAGTTTINTSSSIIRVGVNSAVNDQFFSGRIYRVLIRNGIDGTRVLDIDASAINSTGATSFSALTGQTVTVNRAATGRKTAIVSSTNWLFGTDDFMVVPARWVDGSSKGVFLPGVTNNYMQVPDAAPLRVTGDIDVRVQVAPDSWTASQTLLRKYSVVGTFSYQLSTNTSGNLIFAWSADGSTFITKTSTVTLGLAAGTKKWVRATLDVDNGASGNDVKFYTSDDGTTWTQLGTTVTTAGITSIFSSTAVVIIGEFLATSGMVMYRAQIYSDLTQTTKVLDIDTSVITSLSQTTFTELSSNAATVTINRFGTGYVSTPILYSGYVLPTGSVNFSAAPYSLLDFGATDPFTLFVVARNMDTLGTNDALIAKKINTTATTQGWALTSGSGVGTVSQVQLRAGDGSAGATALSGSRGSGVLAAVAGVRDVAADSILVYLNGTAGTAVTDPTTGSLANSELMRVGRLSGAGTEYNDMQFTAAAIFRRALTAAEVATLSAYFSRRAIRNDTSEVPYDYPISYDQPAVTYNEEPS